MSLYKRILCPIDFSQASLDSLKTASDLAAQSSAELILLNVQPISVLPPEVLAVPGFDFVRYERQQAEDAHKRLEGIAGGVVPPNVTCQILIQMGDAGHEILEMARTAAVDLIVIATHGMSGWRHYLYGSVTQRVLQNTPCSVLVIRSAAPRNK
jgi:universal stress protein A